jgi:glycosyltransferase involved in cell wall biosynthesis
VRIAFLAPSAGLGGAEWSLLDLISSLGEHDPALDLWLVTVPGSGLASRARDLGVTCRDVAMPPALARAGDSAMRSGGAGAAARAALRTAAAGPAAWTWGRALGRALSSIGPDIIHTNDNKSHLISAWMPGRTAPVVWHVRDFIGRRRLMSRALGASARRAAGVLAISEAVARDARTVVGGTPVITVYNAIDLDRFTPRGDRADLDALAGMAPAAPGTLRVGLVAAYARWKGHDLFLDAAARCRGWAHPVRFYVVGGPIYRTSGSQWSEAELREEAVRRGVGEEVAFIGFREDTPAVYRALDVVVQASTEPEPFGRTIVEAMACARPVVVSRAGGAAELITAGEDALVFEPRDAAGLAGALQALAGDETLRARLAAQGRATAQRRFSRRRLGPEVLAAYRRFVTTPIAAVP